MLPCALGVVDGSESLSAPVWSVIFIFDSSSNSSDIHATFVKTMSWVPFACVTIHSISIVSDLGSPVVYAGRFVVFVLSLVIVILFASLSTTAVNPSVFILLNCRPVGNWSIIFVALPGFSPSLYIVKLYVTTSPVFTGTGFFLCLYVAVLFVAIVLSSIFGTLESFSANTVFPTFVIYFLNAKSNSFAFVILITGCWSAFVEFAYNVIAVLDVAVPFSYWVAFVFAVLIK